MGGRRRPDDAGLVRGRSPPAGVGQKGSPALIVEASEQSSGFEVEIVADDEVVSIRATGEADMACRRAFEMALRQAAERAPKVVVLDLRPLSFMDASGLSVILEADAHSRDQGWTLVILRGPPRGAAAHGRAGGGPVVIFAGPPAVPLAFEARKPDGRLHIVGDPPQDERS